MKKGWRILLIVFLVMVLLGTASLLVGYLTGADITRIYSVLDGRYHFDAWTAYFQQIYDMVLQTWASI